MISFVGAGPGDKELITVKGMNILAEADCIIYAGSLVNPALLDYAKEGCAIHNSATMTLEEVLAVMVENEERGLHTARLHTGDPSLYGAIKEQFDQLQQLDIKWEVIPGVSSFSGAAAALNSEYTPAGISQTLIITRMEGRTPVPEREKIVNLAKSQSSMCIFLSSSMLEDLSAKLIEGGYSADTPAAIVYKVTWPDEKIFRTTLADLAKVGAENKISKTALILVGDFLGDDYERSFLYHPEFTTEFRQGKSSHA
ncbi:MAG: precorrin-4 C(11)-methyltransferase [Coriobacteriales bacterium]|jgi:precorrin-4/cobalt-precorrin-4 C11-methyltransferase|nr:precorrin-4 C(11)-methyltransferase [Coriobacteriales bacterium]